MDLNVSSQTNESNQTETTITGRQFSQIEIFVIIVLTGIFSLVTITGNLLIMVAFSINKKLRIMNNYFLVSLSVADFFVGLLAVPFYTVYILIGNWSGPIACDIWLCLDYGLTTTSTFHLLIISLDRYIAVKHPLFHRVHRTSKRLLSVIFTIWIVSFSLWVPTIFIISYPKYNLTVPTKECLMPYIYSKDYIVIVIVSAVTFWIPVFFMVVFYQRVYSKVLKHKAFIKTHMHKQITYFVNNDKGFNTNDIIVLDNSGTSDSVTFEKCELNGTKNLNDVIDENYHNMDNCSPSRCPYNIKSVSLRDINQVTLNIHNGNEGIGTHMDHTSPKPCIFNDKKELQQDMHNISFERSTHNDNEQRQQMTHHKSPKRNIESTNQGSQQKNEAKKNNYKAVKTLSAILIAYIITWAPWQTYTVSSYFCKDCLPTIFYYFAYYFAYVNSTVNPFLYASCNVTFRTTIIQLISRRKRSC